MRSQRKTAFFATATLTTLGVLGASASASAQQAALVARARNTALFTAAESLGNLSVVGQGTVAYHYARGPLSVDLVNRDGSWTLDEAKAVRDSIDLLPDVYIRKVASSGVAKLIRDADHPQVPLNSIFGVDWAAAVTVVEWPFQYVTYGNNVFQNGFAWTYEVVTHEFGHCVDYGQNLYGFSQSGFWSISWNVLTLVSSAGLKDWNGFVTDYARSNEAEDFAECCAYYWLNPDRLAAANPAKYRYMHDVIFEGAVSPAAAHEPGNKPVPAWIVPQVTGLGSASADNYATISIYGNYFMGAFDGGWNDPRFGGSDSATHVAISRTHMYATVPGIDPGSAPVAVRTEDGTSNAAAFQVTKPWWKFW
jgi:hypothetical protein